MHFLSIVCIAILTCQAQVNGSFFWATEDVERLKRLYGDNILNTCSRNVDVTKCIANALKVLRTDSNNDDDEVSCTSATMDNRSEMTEISEDYPSGDNAMAVNENCAGDIESKFYKDEYDYFEKLEKNIDYKRYDGPYAEYFNDSCFRELSALNYSIAESVSQYDAQEYTSHCKHYYQVMKFCDKKTFTYDNMVPEFVQHLDYKYCDNEQVWYALGLKTKYATDVIVAVYTGAFSLVGLIVVWLYFTDR